MRMKIWLAAVLCAAVVPARAQQLPNLTNAAPAARFTITDRVWSTNSGAASICLWEDDKLAALSITVDDNSAPNINWWMTQADTYGFKMTWFVITSLIGGSNPTSHGTWPVYSNILARGHDVQSHSVTHENTDAEYQNSQIAIETNFPGHKCDFLAYPGGTTYPLDPVAAAKYYSSARGTGGSINLANKIAYMNVNATSSPNLTNTAASWSYLPYLFVTNDVHYRGWSVQIFHWVADYSLNAQPLLNFYDANRANLWCGRYGDVAKYGQERDTATLTTSENSAARIALSLTDQMLDSRFDYPLTIKVKMPATWLVVQATQNGIGVESQVINHNGNLYALVKAVPDQGQIVLTSGAAASFSVSPFSGWSPLTVTFTDTSTISGITNRFWDFGNGATTNTAATNVTHTYIAAGTNTVQLIVSSSAGLSTNTQTAAVMVITPVAPTASFTRAPTSGTAPLAVTFTDTSTGSITNRYWSFGDGSTTNTAATSVAHIYASAGTNTVQLIVSGPAGVSTNTQTGAVTVTVPTPPTASFNATPVSGTYPLAVAFTDTSTGSITNRFWNFGDGATTNTIATSVAHTYNSAGTNTVQLIVSGLAGSSTNTLAGLISVAAPSGTATTNIIANGNDQSWRSDGSSNWIGSATDRIGSHSVAGVSVGVVIPFLIPNLGGLQIVSAELSVTLPTNSGLTYATGAANADVYGVRSGTNSTTVLSDYAGGTLLIDNLFNIKSSLSIGEKTSSDPTLASWISGQVGTNGGKYVFITIRPDVVAGASQFATISTANAATGQPVLRLTMAAAASGPADTDADGIPDSWESQYFGGSTNANPNAIAANGRNTIRETYIAGLNPTNPASVFAISNDRNVLGWNATSGRVYSIYGTTNLLNGLQPLATNILWPQNSWTNGAQGGRDSEFYRLSVEIAP